MRTATASAVVQLISGGRRRIRPPHCLAHAHPTMCCIRLVFMVCNSCSSIYRYSAREHADPATWSSTRSITSCYMYLIFTHPLYHHLPTLIDHDMAGTGRYPLGCPATVPVWGGGGGVLVPLRPMIELTCWTHVCRRSQCSFSMLGTLV